MKSTYQEWMEAVEPLMKQALDALRRYHEAQAAGSPSTEVERLRWEAEKLFREVNDLQLKAFGGTPGTAH